MCRKNAKKWNKNTSELKAENLVFLNESGINTNLTRLYAHASKSERAVDSAPLNKSVTTNVLSSIRLDGMTLHTTYQGETKTQKFYDYIKDILILNLKKDDIVIMDNMRSHHTKMVTQLLDDKNISYKFLPPYSPDLNPIEKMWSKMKVFLRKEKIRSIDKLSDAVNDALKTVSVSNCIGWFHYCGYMR